MPYLIKSLDCPLCGVTKFKKRFTKKGRDFYRCCSCKLELQWPLPTMNELEAYYDGSFSSGMYQEFAAAQKMKVMTAQQRLKEIDAVVPMQGRWLDVGCANGVFVEEAGKRGIDASGVELSQHAVEIGLSRGLNLSVGTVDDLAPTEHYDCITAFDVLEHVLEPNPFLASIHARLTIGGHVVLTVPNAGGLVRRMMGKRWYFYIPEEHLHYFTARNLTALVTKHGFQVLQVGATHKPITYDYALTQFVEYNPLIYRILGGVSYAVPSKLRARPIPLPIGELRIIARRL